MWRGHQRMRLSAFRFLYFISCFFVARPERSVIRQRRDAAPSFPDFASLDPGYGSSFPYVVAD
jgi:hypothetical protein